MSSSHAPSSKATDLNPRTTSYEWFGPVGAAFMVMSLPMTVLGLLGSCGATSCSLAGAITLLPQTLQDEFTQALPHLPMALVAETAWLLLHSLLYLSPLGTMAPGLPLRNGKTLQYQINALHAFVICHALAALLHVTGAFNFGLLAEHFFALALGAIIISTVMSVALYLGSYAKRDALLALNGNSGNMFYDFWVGRELNPRIGALDLKFMCELRPGLIGWSLLNWSYVTRAHAEGTAGPAIVLIAVLESFYILDGLFFEAGNVSMMDITTDGFGFMLCFGDLTWVPFLYTLKTRFLYYYPQDMSTLYVAVCVLFYVAGYVVFRGANMDKDRFRRNPSDPSVRHLKVMKTSAGKSLIVSGYWGICRHPNYVGDWLMTLSESLLTGSQFALPYFQPIYFAILLLHRQLRDEEFMQAKYGAADWREFCSRVPYRLIPSVY